MSKSISCSEMGYSCVFSISAGDDEQDLLLDTTQQHAIMKHPELIENNELRPDIKQKLRDLLNQAHFGDQVGIS